jgi:septal ring factor EnvC (AmiA/AmiB activator)
LWEPIRVTLADPKRLEAAAAGLLAEQGPDPVDLAARIKDHERRLEAITKDRMRTFREAPHLGLTNDETRRLLRQLADEHEELGREISNLQGQLHVIETQLDPIARAQQLTAIAAANLNDATLEDQATTVELLDIRIKTIADGYEISGSVPLDDHLTGGKIPTRDLQHP